MTIDVAVPGSKSLTIRALFAAGLAEGESLLEGALHSGDTMAARHAVQAVGARVVESPDGWHVIGVGGHPVEADRPIDVGESGLTSRIMIAVGALVYGRTVLTGRGRLPERPFGELATAMESQGLRLLSFPGEFPMVVEGRGGLPGGRVRVDATRSTQFITALALVAPFATNGMRIEVLGRPGAMGYVSITKDVLQKFGGDARIEERTVEVTSTGLSGTRFVVEGDASAAVYPWLVAALTGETITVSNLGVGTLQPDFGIAGVFADMGCVLNTTESTTTITGPSGKLAPVDVDLSDSPDGALGVAVACLFASGESRLRGLRTLRLKESDRLAALSAELEKAGASVTIEGEDLLIRPGSVTPTVINAHGDHRIAMAFGVLGLLDPRFEIDEPNVVDKTWPGYWDFVSTLK